jgi:hypothetical protein
MNIIVAFPRIKHRCRVSSGIGTANETEAMCYDGHSKAAGSLIILTQQPTLLLPKNEQRIELPCPLHSMSQPYECCLF